MRGAQEYGIELSYRPLRQPHYGGHIERLIGTMVENRKGLAGSQPVKRGAMRGYTQTGVNCKLRTYCNCDKSQ
jgi:hypothetical protein